MFCQKNFIIREIEFHEKFCQEDMEKKAIEESLRVQPKKPQVMQEREKVAMKAFNAKDKKVFKPVISG